MDGITTLDRTPGQMEQAALMVVSAKNIAKAMPAQCRASLNAVHSVSRKRPRSASVSSDRQNTDTDQLCLSTSRRTKQDQHPYRTPTKVGDVPWANLHLDTAAQARLNRLNPGQAQKLMRRMPSNLHNPSAWVYKHAQLMRWEEATFPVAQHLLPPPANHSHDSATESDKVAKNQRSPPAKRMPVPPKKELPVLMIGICGLRFHDTSFVHRDVAPDITVDTRAFVDPAAGDLKQHDGRHPKILQTFVQHAEFRDWLDQVKQDLSVSLEEAVQNKRDQIVMAICCRSGRHRSVAGATIIQHIFGQRSCIPVRVSHLSNAPCGCSTCNRELPECDEALQKALQVWDEL